MDSAEIRRKFLKFFQERGHTVVPSSSLVPDDPSVLLTTAGMQQFKRYFTGELDASRDFKSRNTCSVQKSFRTSDIDEVGDESHLTFFEMLGNFSFGGYFKREAIRYAYEFITKEMGLEIDYVTVFDPAKVAVDDWRKNAAVFDQESYDVWKNEIGLPEDKIRREGVDNFWGPTGNEGPCGPTTEIYVKNSQGKSVEIWNVVFNQFYCGKNKALKPLDFSGVDTGMGLERLAMVSQKVSNIFETDLFQSLLALLPEDLDLRVKRIVVDHCRGIAFLISDGVRPSNKEAGYILRRLMRRVVVHEYLGEGRWDARRLLDETAKKYGAFYSELDEVNILTVFEEEKARFMKTLKVGLRELSGMSEVDAKTGFKLYESFGLPYEIIKELGGEKAKGLKREEFDEEFRKHQEISRAGAEKKFGGHGLLLDTGELKAKDEEELKKVTRLHTATHLMQAALRKVLGKEVQQKGSDITVERTRFDFNFPRKLTTEEIKAVEDWVNDIVKRDLPVNFVELPKEEAVKTGALFFFKEKYPERVKVYYVGKSLEEAVSKEFCGGPHVTHTGLVGKFKIAKEEAVGAGVRRVRGIVE